MAWEVRLTGRTYKNLRRLPQGIAEIFQILLAEIKLSGPIRSRWPNYGRLQQKDCFHCHLQRGKPTWVAVWRVIDKGARIVEVTYVGTHEKAHYHRLC